MTRLVWLAPDSPPEAFPDPASALSHPNGLLAAGGTLEPDRLLAAYRRGIFPWYQEGQPILWWSPDPRAVLHPDEFHVSRSLRRTLRRGHFTLSVNTGFESVVHECAVSRDAHGTWLLPEMQCAYLRLHELGYAQSVETRRSGELVGGIYGVTVAGVFFGESMFSRENDASKVAMAGLVALMRRYGIGLLDCQMPSAHLERMGSRFMPRKEFVTLLERNAGMESGRWPRQELDTRGLAG